MFELLFKWISRNEKPEFVKNPQEFLSLWTIAHAWEDLDPQATDTSNIPQSIRERLDMLMLAYIREELSIRQINGYRLLGHHLWHIFLRLDKNHERLADNLFRKRPLEIDFIDNLFVKRSELIRWCEKEYLEPPACWAPIARSATALPAEEEADDNDGWYEKLTDRRKTMVAALEVAKALWKRNDTLSYEEIYRHPAITEPGFHRFFSLDSFKKWARPFAPEKVKTGGRRPQSIS